MSESQKIDFTMMYVTHSALRRDAERFAAAVASGRSGAPSVRAGWENFKAQLHVHHTVEDDDLWPRLYTAVGDDPEPRRMLQEMEDEHAVLDPVLAEVDAALVAQDAEVLAARVDELGRVLDHHLRHEEDSALPLIQEVLTPEDWKGFGAAMRRKQGLKGAAMYVPWIVDGASGDERRRFFSALPGPLKIVNRLVFEPRYRRLGLWTT